MDFTGKTALVTGTAGAIGKDIALKLYKNGAKVFISDINQDAVDAAACDAFDGKIDILVNVAGMTVRGRVISCICPPG